VTFVAYCENSVQYVPPGGFFGIQILQNSISARALLLTPCWACYAPQIPYSRLGRGTLESPSYHAALNAWSYF